MYVDIGNHRTWYTLASGLSLAVLVKINSIGQGRRAAYLFPRLFPNEPNRHRHNSTTKINLLLVPRAIIYLYSYSTLITVRHFISVIAYCHAAVAVHKTS